MTAAAGSLNSSTMRAAASRSSRLVYDSSLPCSIASPGCGAESSSTSAAALMRVLAVAKIAHLPQVDRQAAGNPLAADAREPGIVCR